MTILFRRAALRMRCSHPLRQALSVSRCHLCARSDIVGFSGIASRCSAREVCDMLNSLYVRFDALIESPKFAEAGIYKARSRQ